MCISYLETFLFSVCLQLILYENQVANFYFSILYKHSWASQYTEVKQWKDVLGMYLNNNYTSECYWLFFLFKNNFNCKFEHRL